MFAGLNPRDNLGSPFTKVILRLDTLCPIAPLSVLKIIMKQQMELSFDSSSAFRPIIRRQPRLRRARWWFNRMRQIVDHARDIQPAHSAGPEQADFATTRRKSACPTPSTLSRVNYAN